MKRNKFLMALITGAAVAPSMAAFGVASAVKNAAVDRSSGFKIPPYLKPGDRIGITSPAGFITLDDIKPAVKKMQEWGFIITTGSSIGKRDFTFGGTDAERLEDLQQMLDDENIGAIMCARGGYGAVRLIDKLDFKAFSKKPKWLIGFSDITVLHSHINRQLNIATIHSKMCNSFPSDWLLADALQKETIESIGKCLRGEAMNYTAAVNIKNRIGKGSGQLVGGNLKTIETLAGSKSDLLTDHKILFVEDTGEYAYSIDRMFWNLKRTGKLARLSGLIIGGFKVKKDEVGDDFGKTLEDIVLEKTSEYDYPVCFDFPVGHQKNNFALKCGISHELIVTRSSTTLQEKQ